jgi:hypothetical protein
MDTQRDKALLRRSAMTFDMLGIACASLAYVRIHFKFAGKGRITVDF